MDLHNASAFYKAANLENKKSPKEWLKLRTSKDLLEFFEHGEIIGDDGEYYFDDRLLFHYDLYLYPDHATKYMKGTTEHWCDTVKKELQVELGEGLFRLVFQKALQRVTGVAYVDFSRKYGIQDVWGCLSHEARDVIASFLSIVLVNCKAYKRPIDTFYLETIFNNHSDALSRHLLLDRTKTIAENTRGKLYINRKNFIAWGTNNV